MSPETPWIIALLFTVLISGTGFVLLRNTYRRSLSFTQEMLGKVINHQADDLKDLHDRLMAKTPEHYFAMRQEENDEPRPERPHVPMVAVGERMGPGGMD